MAKFWVLLVVSAQLLALLAMAGQREYIRATGDIVYFRTAPRDPRDPLRGDYVRLNFNINQIKRSQFSGTDLSTYEKNPLKKDQEIYVSLTKDGNGVAKLVSAELHPPQSGLYIKGRVNYPWFFRNRNAVNVRYGIEQYFVEQGSGKALEEKMGFWGEIQVPLEVEVALGKDGTAVTRGYRWSDLGIKTEILAMPQRNRDGTDNGVTSPKIKLTIKNVSTQPLVIVDNEFHCGFALESEEWTDLEYPPATNACDNYRPGATDIIQLQPEQEQAFEFDLSQPRWYKLIEGEAKEIGTLRTGERFRLIYHSPSPDALSTLTTSTQLWQGELPSQAFLPTGRID